MLQNSIKEFKTDKNMQIKVGDKVRFLNAEGGGVVSKILGKEMVAVTDEDGFDYPTPARECVVVDDADDEKRIANPSVHPSAKKPEEKKPAKPAPAVHRKSQIEEFDAEDVIDPELRQPETKEGERLTVLLAFVPMDIKQLSATSYECYLINDSNYELAYTVASGNGKLGFRRAAGFIQPNTKVFVEELKKEQLNDIEYLTVQFIAFKKDKAYEVKPVADLRLKINPVKFYKLHSFDENDYFDESAMLVPIVKDDEMQTPYELSAEAIAAAMTTKEVVQPARISKSSKPGKEPMEVDLHIGALLDNTDGMEAKDMLDYQIQKFNEVMAQYQKEKGKRIVFIHGKGDGVLRKAVLDELRHKYPHCQYQDASFREYGFGATLVIIR
jgi:hypothetical protein